MTDFEQLAAIVRVVLSDFYDRKLTDDEIALADQIAERIITTGWSVRD